MESKAQLVLVTNKLGYQAQAFREAAASLGVDCALVSDRCSHLDDPWGDQALAVRFEEAGSQAPVLEALRRRWSDIRAENTAVLALDDRAALTAAELARGLGVRGATPEAVQVCTRKNLMRMAHLAARLPAPAHRLLPLQISAAELARTAAGLHYPVVSKPLHLSGSRGVIRSNNPAEFITAFQRTRELLLEPAIRSTGASAAETILVEDFLPGPEFVLEGFVREGRLETLALYDKPDPLDGPFFEETIYVTPSRLPQRDQKLIEQAVRASLGASGLAHGPVHAEVRWSGGRAYVLETAPRPIGGLCARTLPGLERLLIQRLLPEVFAPAQLHFSGARGVFMLPIGSGGLLQKVSGVERAREVPGVEEVLITAKPKQMLRPLPEGGTYLGFIFAHAETPAEVEQALRTAQAKLKISYAMALPVIA